MRQDEQDAQNGYMIFLQRTPKTVLVCRLTSPAGAAHRPDNKRHKNPGLFP
jgi:hypothetical protein